MLTKDHIVYALRLSDENDHDHEVKWEKVADFAAILPKQAKEQLWNGVFKRQEDVTMAENKRISKVLRTFLMLHLTREYTRIEKEVPDHLRKQLPAMTEKPGLFIAEFIKKPHETHDDQFLSIYNELTRQPIQNQFNQVDFLRQAYLQYILYAYQKNTYE